MSQSKYQVFISSTYEDLVREREEVIKAVLEMGHIPVGMEMFSAADEEQWEIIKRHIDASDYYVVLVAHRYGSTVGSISYTQKEYEYAASVGVPTLGFIVDSSVQWSPDFVDQGPSVKALTAFKTLVKKKPVSFWQSPQDLHAQVLISLVRAITTSPRVGWVRGDTAASPHLVGELARLSSENADLRSQLQDAIQESVSDKEKEFEKLRAIMRQQERTLSYRFRPRDEWRADAKPISLYGLFSIFGAMLIPEFTLEGCARLTAMHITTVEDEPTDIVPINYMKEVLADLMALELVEPSLKKHSVSDTADYWSLTSDGVEFAKWVARKRFEDPGESDDLPEVATDDSGKSATDDAGI